MSRRSAKKPRQPTPQQLPQRARMDGFVNAISGFGTSIDRLSSASVTSFRDTWLRWDNLETLYYEDDIAARVVDAIVDDAMRQGIEIERDADDDGDAGQDDDGSILRRMRTLSAEAKVSEAAKWGRLFGGGAVFVVMDDGAHDKPLRLGRSVVSLEVLDRWELTPATRYTDPALPMYGQIETWRASRRGATESIDSVIIHESRLLRFEGMPVSRIERSRQNGWTLSVLARVYEVLRDAAQNWRAVSNLLNQSTQAVFKLDGLAQMVASGREEDLQQRMAAANLGRSILRAVLIDREGEEFSYQTASMTGLDVILDKTWQRLSAAADMPTTRLMGMSPAGLNATGESDVRGWYDRVQTYRTNALGPQLDRLVQIIAAELGDESPARWRVEWPSLWQMSPTEEAAYRKTIADTDVAYLNAGVLTPQEVAVTRFGGGTFSSAPVQIDLSLRETPTEGDPATTEAAYPKAAE